MIIQKKYIRNLSKYLGYLKEGSTIIFGVPIAPENKAILYRIGFTDPIEIGNTILPSPIFGSVSSFNAEGKYTIRKDLPKETAYRQIEWHWEQWCGYGETESMSKIVDVPYERYPRDFISPPGVELSIGSSSEGQLLLISSKIQYKKANEKFLIHVINLFLEIFSSVHVFTADLDSIDITKTKRLNWTILPEGEYPWERIQPLVTPILDRASTGNRPVLRNRYGVISSYIPKFVAVGNGGFSGYLIFGFPGKGIYVCESAFYGNATYIFDQDWQELSKLTKAQILSNDLQKDRLIHREDWEQKVAALLE